MHNTSYHIPVLCSEAISALAVRPHGIYVDATYGGGGHAKAIHAQLKGTGHLYAFDQDAAAFANVEAADRMSYLPMNFRHLQTGLKRYGVKRIHGLLADLGVSSYQLDKDMRGFSVRRDAPLDMRMRGASNEGWNAADWLSKGSFADLKHIFSAYGELRRSATMARKLCEVRAHTPIERVFQLRAALAEYAPPRQAQRFWAQLFQALRIAVNDELNALKELLTQAAQLMITGGRLVIISYHSLEDRIVKRFLRTGHFDSDHKSDLYGHRKAPPFESLYKKPIYPSADECKRNNRARSAKMRVGIKRHP